MKGIKNNGFLSVHSKDLDLVNNKNNIKNITIINNPLWPVNIQPIIPTEDEIQRKYWKNLFLLK